ncbi:MAG: hypothetical protein IJ393_00470 [Clostridia bacterium]|nr:hypothetical protein [Clostridia bacterium]
MRKLSAFRSPALWADARRLDQNSRITIGGTAVFDSTACDGERWWEPFCGNKTLCLTKLGF